jgi:DNA-directed RNA polymerase I subunit RPA12
LLQDYRRRYKLEPIAAPTSDADAAAAAAAAGAPRNRSTVDEPCVKCGHVGLDFYTMQLRSADEGSTVFYECRACGHKWNQNN